VKTRILLADDHALVRAGLCSLLEKIPSVQVIAEAKDGREAVELVRRHRPHVAMVDIAMPKMNGLEAAVRITREVSNVKVIVLSMYTNQEYVVQAMRAGASGYLIKDDAPSELKQAIRSVISGQLYFSPRISKDVIKRYLQRVSGEPGPSAQLTPRQREILQLIVEGNSTKEIAFSLGLSGKTVDAHRLQLMEKLHIHDLPGLVRYAMRVGLVPTEAPVRQRI
jgi:DNA-binding NarL/FixJ family response regulator